ncbi:Selenoprotein T2 [Bagarius yarrelli]|uniref:Selenoprotein T n=1 Tax=Bagarius yarrelli TaxID=175774 RepID=A0A556V3S6_BAGYA|nr:Selenoprotein T2 [Bagarius yarrelli]
MAEYSHTGILTALLLFTAVTVRDIYLGRTATEQLEPQTAKSNMASNGFPEAESNTARQNKPKFYTGPVLKFQYCKVFQEYSRSINQLYPDIRIEGENYPPKLLNKYIANFVSYFKLLVIALVVTGQNPFQMLGTNTPRIWFWGQENKIFSCLMVFFLSNMLETQFLSTGAFEITLNGEEVVDLTCEGSEPAVVDLTNNDSVVVFFFLLLCKSIFFGGVALEGTQSRRMQGTESYVLSSDDEEEPSPSLSPAHLSSLHASARARSTPGAVSCPVCMDAYAEIIESGRLMVSTKCGHLFCSQCIRDSLARAHNCPTCRKKLTTKQYHPIYI